MKDLKRQLHAERKRAEKLQEKFQEVLTDSKHNKSMLYMYTVISKKKFPLLLGPSHRTTPLIRPLPSYHPSYQAIFQIHLR